MPGINGELRSAIQSIADSLFLKNKIEDISSDIAMGMTDEISKIIGKDINELSHIDAINLIAKLCEDPTVDIKSVKDIAKDIQQYVGVDVGDAIGEFVASGKFVYSESVSGALDVSIFQKLLELGKLTFFEPAMEKYILLDTKTMKYDALGSMGFRQAVQSMLLGEVSGDDLREFMKKLPMIKITYRPDVDQVIFAEGVDLYLNFFRETEVLRKFKEYASGESKEDFKKPELINIVIDNVTGGGEKAIAFKKWLAFWLRSRRKSVVSWVFYGGKGTGKGTITDIIIPKIWGKENCALEVGAELLAEKWNGWLENKVFASLNEINFTASDRHRLKNKLKLLSGDTIAIRKMQRDSYNATNYANFIISSNDETPIDLEVGDRRYNVCHSLHGLIQNERFNEIVQEKIKEMGGAHIKDAISAIIDDEIDDFMFELSRLNATASDYVKVIDDDDKRALTMNSLSTMDEILVAIGTGNIESVIDNVSYMLSSKNSEYEARFGESPAKVFPQYIASLICGEPVPVSHLFANLSAIGVAPRGWTATKFTRHLKSIDYFNVFRSGGQTKVNLKKSCHTRGTFTKMANEAELQARFPYAISYLFNEYGKKISKKEAEVLVADYEFLKPKCSPAYFLRSGGRDDCGKECGSENYLIQLSEVKEMYGIAGIGKKMMEVLVKGVSNES